MPFQRVGKSLGRGNGLQVDAGIHQGEEFHFIEEMQGVPRIDALAAMEELLIPACQHDVMVAISDARIVKNGKCFVLPADTRQLDGLGVLLSQFCIDKVAHLFRIGNGLVQSEPFLEEAL